MHALMDDSKLQIIQSYEQGLVPAGLDKRGPTVCIRVIFVLVIDLVMLSLFQFYLGTLTSNK